MCDNEAVTHRMRALDLSSDHQRELRANILLNYRFYVNYRTTAANDAYPDLSPAKRRWDKLRQYVAIGFVRVEAESTVTLLQPLAQSLRSDVEEAKAKQNYAIERVTAAEDDGGRTLRSKAHTRRSQPTARSRRSPPPVPVPASTTTTTTTTRAVAAMPPASCW